jgi:opacity protein-like surface antigen
VKTLIQTLAIFGFSLIASIGQASAQDGGLVGGNFGVTFGTEAAPFFSGEVAGHVARDVQIYGTVGRMNNVLPSSVQDDLDDVSAFLTMTTRMRWDFKATAPALFGTAGVRYLVPTGSPARPYVQGGVGFANIGLKVEEVDLGEVTDDLVDEGYLDDDNINKMAIEFGGGLIVPLRAMYIDLGYRFMKLLDADDVNISRAYGGIGVRF